MVVELVLAPALERSPGKGMATQLQYSCLDPWGHKESDSTKQQHFHFSQQDQ